jgi:exonuclease III
MKLISWNVRGLNAPSKHKMLKKRINQEKAEVVLIQETKCDKVTMIRITKKIWKNCEVEVVDSEGALGGLVILWDP